MGSDRGSQVHCVPARRAPAAQGALEPLLEVGEGTWGVHAVTRGLNEEILCPALVLQVGKWCEGAGSTLLFFSCTFYRESNLETERRLRETCSPPRKRGIEVVQLNLSRPIEEQGPLDVIIHKLTDVILEADQNDSQSLELVHRFQEYIDAHPETIVLDPLPAIRTLLDRSKSYELIRKIEAYMKDDRICSPPFMELTSLCGDDTMRLLEQNGLAFPFICKTRVAHGTNSHEMAIVFNQEGLSAIQPPCVVQNFINHNAVLYKVFVVGESYTVVQRPSLKNFSAGTSDRESIFFNSHNVSKPESSSVLTELDRIEGVFERPSDEVIRELSRALRQALGVSLFGIDVIINNQTGQHAVIDINAFPGYEGVSEFFTDLLNHIATVLQDQSTGVAASGDVAPLRHSRLLAEQAGSLAGDLSPVGTLRPVVLVRSSPHASANSAQSLPVWSWMRRAAHHGWCCLYGWILLLAVSSRMPLTETSQGLFQKLLRILYFSSLLQPGIVDEWALSRSGKEIENIILILQMRKQAP
ncbi:inositol-tetrakisphosphate 1-kinase [Fukomys damarensis]|uniref:inositol-tetrakisphosphate 1-kinase n=1 Tax=Fukomys damarensis TaxID=885580 RepID=UPI001455CF23|nr:inositol-tetrakisphosphate 1-kinase [Fukomys damarensis]